MLHVSAGNLYGGIETLLVTLARRQADCPGVEFGFTVCFEGRLADELRRAGAVVESLGAVRLSRPWTVFWARRRLAEIVENGRWDVVVTHGSWPHAIAGPVARRRGRPLIYWGHGLQSGRTWLEWLARRWTPDLVLANSIATRNTVAANLFPGSRSEILYLPVSPPQLNDVAGIRAALRAELGADETAVVVITVSRIEPLKGHENLIEALGTLKDIPNWRWWVVGGPQRDIEAALFARLQTRVAELGIGERVRFLGQRTDVPRLLASADVSCQPNRDGESFGIVFIEAMYAGIPVVTTAIGGALEIMDDRSGVLVPPGDQAALKEAVRKLIQDDAHRHRLSRGGPARATMLCDPAARMADLGRLLHDVCPVTGRMKSTRDRAS